MPVKNPNWTDEKALKAQVQKLWDKGWLLAAWFDESAHFPKRLAFKSPDSKAMGENFDTVRRWVASLQNLKGLRLEYQLVRHRVLGENALPVSAWVDSLADALTIIGKQQPLGQFAEVVTQSREQMPTLLPWLQKYPLKALELAPVWPKLLAFIHWCQTHPKPGIYLRQVSIADIDSKFIEQHRATLMPLLELALPETQINPSATGIAGFERRYGFLTKPQQVRFRLLDKAVALLPGDDGEISLTAGDFAVLNQLLPFAHGIKRVFITENEVNFLAFPPQPNSLVIFGAGYGFEPLATARWLQNLPVYYWGDIDSHGFAILNQLRATLPLANSLLMDEATLLRHRQFWGREAQPQQRPLTHLTASEQRLYQQLCDNHFGFHLRLEQERIPFGYLQAVLAGLPALV